MQQLAYSFLMGNFLDVFYVTNGLRTFFRLSRYLTFAFLSNEYGRRHVNVNIKIPAQVRLKGQYHRKKNQCMELIFFTRISYFYESEKT